MGDGFARRRVALEEVAAVGTGDGPMTCAASDEEGLAGGDIVREEFNQLAGLHGGQEL